MIQEETFLSIRALFEHYGQRDCWCGESGDDVLISYVVLCSDPMDSLIDSPAESDQELQDFLACYGPERYPTLKPMSLLTREQRREGLIQDIRALLTTKTTDADRRAELVALGGESLLDFSEFWSPDAEEVAEPGRATAFLAHALTVVEAIDLAKFPPQT